MDARYWARINEVFHEVVGTGCADRTCRLTSLCGSDGALRAEVVRLIELHERAGSFLEPSSLGPSRVAPTAGGVLDEIAPMPQAGDMVGRFRLLRLLGSGGMGDVWLAERADHAFQQTVAVKVVRAAAMFPKSVEQFLAERQTLARLEHPSIARLIDGGATSSAVPYLVMEFVEGVPIDRFCEEQALDRRKRIELFREVCDTVHYAHQNRVVHRDLKPLNILVTQAGQPKLLDFGVAQWLDGATDWQVVRPSLVTSFTPRYASPEQVRGQACTPASDVYSLGVVLRELVAEDRSRTSVGPVTRMAGQRPTQSACRVESSPLGSEFDPELFCTADASARRRLVQATRSRRYSPRDDLERIIDKAMNDDPALRYPTAKQLSDDLGRLLTGYPVEARGNGAIYRARCFVRRNRLLSTSVAVLTVTLMATTFFTTGAWKKASDERDAALAATRFIGSVLASVSPFARGEGASESVGAEVLAATSAQAARQLGSQPEVEIQVRLILAQQYAALWQWAQVRAEATRALDRITYAEMTGTLLEARCLALLGRAQTWLGEAAAIDTQRRALAIRLEKCGPTHVDVAEALVHLGFVMWQAGDRSRWPEADEHYARGIDMYRRLGVTCSADFARSLFSHSCFRREQGDIDGAEPLVRESALCFAQLGDVPDRYHLSARWAYGCQLLERGQPGAAATELSELMRITPFELDGEESSRSALWTLGRLERLRRHHDEAFQAFRRALHGECLARASSAANARTWRVAATRLLMAEDPGDLVSTVHDLKSLLFDDPSFQDSRLVMNLATAASTGLGTSHAEAAGELIQQLRQHIQRACPGEVVRQAVVDSLLAELDFDAGRFDQALERWSRCADAFDELHGVPALLTQPTIQGLVRASEAIGRLDIAEAHAGRLFQFE